MESLTNDTSKAAEEILIKGYRQMPAQRKLQQITALTQAIQKMALTRLRMQYPDMNEREEKLRLAALWLSREMMITEFGWDPVKEGY